MFYEILNLGDYYAFASLGIISLASFVQLIAGSRSKTSPGQKTSEPKITKTKTEQAKPSLSWGQRLGKGLSKTREKIWGGITPLLAGSALKKEHLDELEEMLYSTDLGAKTVSEIIEGLEERMGKQDVSLPELKEYLRLFLKEKMDVVQGNIDDKLFNLDKKAPLQVFMIVGINGAGKTTTIGKLATKLTSQGAKVVVGACDTFRAAAVEQLEVWCKRSGATMVKAKEGANPTGVAYEALQTAINEKADYCLLDTAGRLHTKENLMEELKKNKTVLKKLDKDAPHQVLLVLDAITGQNALRQAEEFHKYLELSGLILTKCDGSSKAGSAVSIQSELNVPIAYIGVGEGVEDLDRFNTDSYLDALIDA